MQSPAWMFSKALSHRQKVCRLFKRAMRELDGYFGSEILEARYHKVVLRARFDAYSQEKDPRKANLMYLDGCRQVWLRKHWTTFRFGSDIGGASYDRDTHSTPDVFFDSPNYTDAEREQFPYYFNRREQRKKELLQHWAKIEKDWDDELAKIQTELPKSTQSTAEK